MLLALARVVRHLIKQQSPTANPSAPCPPPSSKPAIAVVYAAKRLVLMLTTLLSLQVVSRLCLFQPAALASTHFNFLQT